MVHFAGLFAGCFFYYLGSQLIDKTLCNCWKHALLMYTLFSRDSLTAIKLTTSALFSLGASTHPISYICNYMRGGYCTITDTILINPRHAELFGWFPAARLGHHMMSTSKFHRAPRSSCEAQRFLPQFLPLGGAAVTGSALGIWQKMSVIFLLQIVVNYCMRCSLFLVLRDLGVKACRRHFSQSHVTLRANFSTRFQQQQRCTHTWFARGFSTRFQLN